MKRTNSCHDMKSFHTETKAGKTELEQLNNIELFFTNPFTQTDKTEGLSLLQVN